MPILLSDEEIYSATRGKEGYDLNIARAQLKKVVEYLLANEQDYSKLFGLTNIKVRFVAPDAIKALKEALD